MSLQGPKPVVAQWRRTDFCFLPSADFLLLTWQGIFGGAFVQLRWALFMERTVDLSASAIGVAQFVSTHTGHEAVHTPGKESQQDMGWPLTSSGGASRTDQKVSRKVL